MYASKAVGQAGLTAGPSVGAPAPSSRVYGRFMYRAHGGFPPAMSSTTTYPGAAPAAAYLPPPPPGYAFGYRYAGLISRFFAVLIDSLLLLALTLAIGLPLGLLAAAATVAAGPFGWAAGLLFGPFLLLLFAAWILYFTYFESTSGQTPGKHLLNLRVVDPTTGRPPSAGRALLRSLLRIVDWAPALYLLGFVVALVTEHKQRLGDLVAGTVVVRV